MKLTPWISRICSVTLLCWGLVGVAGAAHAADATGLPVKAAPKFIEAPGTRSVLAVLRTGGFVLYLRHGTTDNSRPDRFPSVDLDDCATQRPLTEEGRQLAAQVGRAMRAAQIPIGDIFISPMCRVKDTTAAAFPGRDATLDMNLMYTANLTTAQKVPILERTRWLVSEPVTPGANRLLVAHGPNLMDLMGYFPKEGTLVVFRPRGQGRFDYVASFAPGLWAQLLPAGALK